MFKWLIRKYNTRQIFPLYGAHVNSSISIICLWQLLDRELAKNGLLLIFKFFFLKLT